MARAAVVFILLLTLALAPPARGQTSANVMDLLNDPKLKPFIEKVLGIQECLANIAGPLLQFDINQCPSLLRMLDALQLGNSNPAVTCELSCVEQFDKLSEGCFKELMDAFSSDTSDVGRPAALFFEECDATVAAGQQAEAATPAPAPVPTPVLAPAEGEKDGISPSPAPDVAAAPTPVPVLYSGSLAGSLPKSILYLLSMSVAAFMLLA